MNFMNRVYINGAIGGAVFALVWLALTGFNEIPEALLGGLVFAITFSLVRKYFS